MTTTAEILRGLPYFSDLPNDLISRVCEKSNQIRVDEGTVIIEEGSDSEEMYVVVSGELSVTKSTSERDVELARLGPGEVVGEIALLDRAPRTATVTATKDAHLIEVPVAAFEDLLGDPTVIRRMFHTVTSRLRGIEQTLRHEERMAALGRMAAQLMHELNNPAAAVVRSTRELEQVQELMRGEVELILGNVAGQSSTAEATRSHLTPLQRADLEERLAQHLANLKVTQPWTIAPALAAAGWTETTLDAAIAGVAPELRPHLARWIGLESASAQLLQEVLMATGRISELVRVVKEYSFVDRAPVQEIDLTKGIEDTLVLLKHKLRDIEVDVDFSPDLRTVTVPGRDLNQVWTNLVDNAADAMDGMGRLSVSARNDGDDVIVEFADTGPGIPDDVADRIFDPFFTTKEPGKGTGLGMHTVHTIINRIGGDISLKTGSGGTTFIVRIPTGS